MKSLMTVLGVMMASQFAAAHEVHPLVENYGKSIEDAYDVALHSAGYKEKDFDDLAGVSSLQDAVKKVRVLRFTFTEAQCAKNLEVYLKLDGTKYLAHKVVGCK